MLSHPLKVIVSKEYIPDSVYTFPFHSKLSQEIIFDIEFESLLIVKSKLKVESQLN